MRTISRYSGDYTTANIKETFPRGAGEADATSPRTKSGGAADHKASFVSQLFALIPWKIKFVCGIVGVVLLCMGISVIIAAASPHRGADLSGYESEYGTEVRRLIRH